ncbi:MAG: CBS domain-containing protein [Haloarculaceae archaeon]
MFGPVPVTEVMRTPAETTAPDATALAAARRLRDADVDSLVVVEDGTVVGIVTESDVLSLVVEGGDVAETPVESVMSAPVHTVDTDATVVAAAEALRERGVEELPVVADGDLAGIVTTAEIADYFPHVRRPLGEAGAGDDETLVRETSRRDLAYEEDDWEFEYVGHEDAVDVGDVVRFSKPLDDAEVEAFADASGDTNRLHLDDGYAAGTRFGRRIVHGTLVAGLVSAALARLPGLVIYLSQEVSYLGPVDVGERVSAECTVVEELGRDRYRLATTVTGADDETVVDGEAVVMIDPVPDAA